ncbi:universal stress protein [Nitrolancea hollandica]|uniref:UspA domain protein n=1 Tax=Nitrolancea hollandica Lb TaxID=1129897 RepID=I4EI14_9BACT|nr:universal stress protein [Nitrolancea hollandica]CCF84326.1 UspA domain protein [Nitrolancea hollandica Lb]
MIDAVIVALDGSKLAEQALPLAKQIAEHLGARLSLLQVIPPDAPAERQDEAAAYLEETARELLIPTQVMVRIGKPADEIIASAVDAPESIIVMMTHGRGGLGRLLYGSVADLVVRDSRVPVLLIRAGLVPSATEPLKSILVPLDGSAYAETALPQAIELARAFDADLWLARVAVANMALGGPLTTRSLAEGYQHAVREAAAYLDEVAERLKDTGVRLHTKQLAGFAEDEILAFERQAAIDLVVIATRARAVGLSGLGIQSLAQEMLRHGVSPVLMIRSAVTA